MLQEKVQVAIAKLRAASWLSPADASKLRGILQLMATGAYGRA